MKASCGGAVQASSAASTMGRYPVQRQRFPASASLTSSRAHRPVAMIQGEQAHHDAGRAEAALRAVTGDHRLLHGMETFGARKILDRDHLGAVELTEEEDAGVHRFIGEPVSSQPPEHHGAGAAIAFGAAFLRADAALAEAQIVEQGRPRVEAADLDHSAAPQEADRLPHGSPFPAGTSGRSSRMTEAGAFANRHPGQIVACRRRDERRASTSIRPGAPLRPPKRVHLIAAAAEAKRTAVRARTCLRRAPARRRRARYHRRRACRRRRPERPARAESPPRGGKKRRRRRSSPRPRLQICGSASQAGAGIVEAGQVAQALRRRRRRESQDRAAPAFRWALDRHRGSPARRLRGRGERNGPSRLASGYRRGPRRRRPGAASADARSNPEARDRHGRRRSARRRCRRESPRAAMSGLRPGGRRRNRRLRPSGRRRSHPLADRRRARRTGTPRRRGGRSQRRHWPRCPRW